MTTSKGISIGENKWIKWVGFDSKKDNEIIEIDNILKPTIDFWDGLETQCVAECCGIDAFSFWEDDIEQSINNLDKTELINNLRDVKSELINTSKTIVSSSRLNNLLDKRVFIELIDHILVTIETKTKE